ncbi:MAG: YfaZ family protein [Desulfobacteraceae bacterium]|nr:YfaZ family protein [Desulfobacteraceae bacterium]MCF8095051.1 YfaZ family protein [Desulfobacteraceae bacterium]
MKLNYHLTAIVLILLLILPAAGFSQERFDLGLQVNNSAIEVLAGIELPTMPGQMRVDANGLYEDDEYKMIGASLTIGDTVITPGLTGRLGFRGIVGKFERTGKDSDLYSSAFVLEAEYDLSSAYLSYYIPVTLRAGANFGPSPLCFGDTENYMELTAGVEWWIIENAALMLNFRYIDVEFNDPVKWDETDSAAYGGIKLRF